MAQSNPAQLLRNVSLFRDLNDEEIDRIQNIAIQRTYKKKQIVFHEGAVKEAVYFINSGFIKAFKTDENGHEHIVSILNSGEMFPHTGLFHDHPYPATAEALIETNLIAIPIRSFEALFMSSPRVAFKVMRVLSEKVKELQEKLQGLTGQDVQDRGVTFLIMLAENYGVSRDDKIIIEVPMTNQEFANAIGTTRETFNRLIAQLRKAGILENDRGSITILDLAALKSSLRKG